MIGRPRIVAFEGNVVRTAEYEQGYADGIHEGEDRGWEAGYQHAVALGRHEARLAFIAGASDRERDDQANTPPDWTVTGWLLASWVVVFLAGALVASLSLTRGLHP
jgi:hypothetical protein